MHKAPKPGSPIATLERLLYFLIGNLFYTFAVNMFFLENNIAAGGFAGIATVLTSLIPLDIGTVVILMNIPFLIWAYFVHGWRYTLITFSASFVYSALLNLFSFLPTATNDLFLASVLGGVFYAIGAVFILKADASVGGTDLVARLLITKFRGRSLGNMFMLVDGFTILFSIFVFKKVELGLYAAVAIYTCSVFTDKIITGFDYASICYVITDSPVENLANAVMKRMSRGVTKQRATGMYGNSEKNMLIIAVRPKEMYKLKDIIAEFDPNAFVFVTWANEVQGGGFQNKHGRYEKPQDIPANKLCDAQLKD